MAIQGKYLYSDSDLSDVYRIRNEVLYNELGVHSKYEVDEKDKLSTIAIVYSYDDETKPVATGRIIFDGDKYVIDQVLVLKEERNQYYGDFVLRLLITKGFLSGAKEIIAETTINCIQFYKKIGFTENGNNIETKHTKYVNLTIKQENICKKCNNF